MDSRKLQKLINGGESETTEFKTSFQKEVIETIVAFANTRGGYIFIGLKDDGAITGVTASNETIKDYINQIKNATEPSLIVDIIPEEISKKQILIVQVDEFPVKPVGMKGKYLKRVKNSNHQMNLTEISNMHIQSLQLSWDSYPTVDVSINDLDTVKLAKFFKNVEKIGRYTLTGDLITDLSKLNLLKSDNTVTQAAKLLFAKEMTLYSIHIGRFKTPSMIIDDKMIKETLFEAVEKSMMFIISHLKVAFEFTGEIKRTEIFEYPIEALRELVLNAIVHRDYTSPIDTQIKIFDKKITIFNPGKLYGNITVDKLNTDNYQAQTRNKLIAEAFYLTGDIEKYGSGYIRVRKEIIAYPTMKFEYEEMGNGFLVTLSYEEQKTQKKTTPKTTPKTTQKTTPKTTREKLLEYIRKDASITRESLADKLGITVNGVKQHISKLKKDGILNRIGGRKSGEWRILEH